MATSDPSPAFTRRLYLAARNFTVLMVVLALAGAAVWALSALNARTYTLEVRDGQLWVLKGRMLPTGFEPYRPADPRLADAYAPLALYGNTSLAAAGGRFTERDELDRALFTIIELLARPRVTSDEPKDLEVGLALVRRAERLSGLSEDQELSLKYLKDELAYFLARQRLDDARRLLGEGLQSLREASTPRARHAREASQMLLEVEPEVQALEQALRSAVHNLGGAPPAPVTPPPAEDVVPLAGADAGS